MADENLRLRAEVVDAFSGPLRTLRSMLQSVSSSSPTDKLKSGMEGAQRAATSFGREVNTTLTPALNAAGIAGLTVTGILAGVGASLRAFSSSASSLQLLSRETNMAVGSMRVLEEVGKRFNIAPEAMQQSFRTFAENSRLLRKGIGEVTTWLNGQGGNVGRWAQQMQRDLAAGLDPDQAYRRALEFMRRIRDPIERGMFAEKVFGNRQLGLLGSEDIGKLIDDVEKKLGQLPKGAAEAALEFKRTWDDFITSMIRLRDTVGITVLPVLKDLTETTTKWLNDPNVKDGVATFFKEIGEQAKNAMGVVKTFVDILNAVREGRFLDAVKLLNSKPVLDISPQNSVPYVGEMGRKDTGPLIERRDQLRRQIELMDNLISRKESEPDPLGGANKTASEERQKRDRLIQELEALTRELEQLRKDRGDAAVQQQSLTGGGPFGGAKLQLAAYGGMAQAGSMLGAVRVPSAGGSPQYGITAPAPSPYSGGKFVGTGNHMLDAIIAAEGTAKGGRDPFNTVLGYGQYGTPSKPLTEMTLNEVKEFGLSMRRAQAARGTPWGRTSSASGAFQIVGSTMMAAARALGLDPATTKFDVDTQRAMALWIERNQGLGAWEGFKSHPDQLAKARRGGSYALPNGGPSAGGIAFNDTIEKFRRQPSRGPVWDFAQRGMGGASEIKGNASVDINLRGFPPGTSTSSSVDGVFKDLRLRRTVQAPAAGGGN